MFTTVYKRINKINISIPIRTHSISNSQLGITEICIRHACLGNEKRLLDYSVVSSANHWRLHTSTEQSTYTPFTIHSTPTIHCADIPSSRIRICKWCVFIGRVFVADEPQEIMWKIHLMLEMRGCQRKMSA